MRIEDVKVVRRPLVLAKRADVDRFESGHWLTFPDGYREYVTRLGEGVLGGDWVRIYPPWRIGRELDEWRERIRRHWFWDAGRKVLPKTRALECVILGDTTGGDELVFHPCRRDRLWVLPRDDGKVFEAGRDLLSAVEWLCGSGELIEPFAERDFEPFDSRKQPSNKSSKVAKAAGNPSGESLDGVIKAAERWAKRHKLLRKARARVKSPLKKLPPKQLTIAARRQSVVFAPGEFEEPSAAVEFELSDAKTGLVICTVEVQQKADGEFDTVIEPDPENWPKLAKRYGGETFDDW
jgi:hypothetical protein